VFVGDTVLIPRTTINQDKPCQQYQLILEKERKHLEIGYIDDVETESKHVNSS
jgi:hypothetical protein